ncbi:MAG TPA: hypothetical protein PKD10_14480, partial [Paracoccaceae bacterium]|nr:hypothetical protein [Paracoccaceae bacterium]
VEEARALGMEAIRLRRPDKAAEIALALLDRDPADAFAHMLMARALLDGGQPKAAGNAARTAFSHAATPVQRQQSARLVAMAAYAEGRLGLSQRWLRRATAAAPEATRAQTARELAAVRRQNPMSVTLRFSAMPSNNVNNGASSEFNIIDGVPIVGWLSPDGMALSGVVAEGHGGFRYRLSQGDGGFSTFLGARVDARRVELSREARAAAPDLDPRRYDSARAEVTWSGLLQPKGKPWEWSLDVGAGAQTEGGAFSYRFLRAGTGLTRGFDDRTAGNVSIGFERRDAGTGARPVIASNLALGLRRILPDEHVLSLTGFIGKLDTPVAGRSSTTLGAEIGWEAARPVGPALLALRASYAKTEFPGYWVGPIEVPGGRRDRTVSAAADLTFPGLAVQGFAPRLTISHSDTSSNVSRFDTRRVGMQFGLSARF